MLHRVQFLDNKSLSLVMRDATDDGRKALKILQKHYASNGKQRIIALYTELTSLKMSEETVTDYIIQSEKALTSLRNAKENIILYIYIYGLIIVNIPKGVPESYKPFAIHLTQQKEDFHRVQKQIKKLSRDTEV